MIRKEKLIEAVKEKTMIIQPAYGSCAEVVDAQALLHLIEEMDEKSFLELPCQVGNTVYWLKREAGTAARIFELEVEQFELRKELYFKAGQKKRKGSLYTFYVNDDWNTVVFGTKDDAMKKAEELNLVIFK